MSVLFIASTAAVAVDPPHSRKLLMDALGLLLEGEGDGYYSSARIAGSKHFSVWPLSEAGEACFGTPLWAVGGVVPRHRSSSRWSTRNCRGGERQALARAL